MSQPWTMTASASLGGERRPRHPRRGPGVLPSRCRRATCCRASRTACSSATRGSSRSCALRVNGQWPEPLAATTIDPFSAAFVLRGQPPPGEADSHLMMFRRRYVGRGMREDLTIAQLRAGARVLLARARASTPTSPTCSRSRKGASEKVGELDRRRRRAGASTWHVPARRVQPRRRTSTSRSGRRSSRAHATFEIIVPPGGDWSVCLQLTPVIDDQEVTPRYLCGRPVERSTPVTRLEAWRRNLPTITADHDGFASLLDRSTEDLAALRLFDPEYPDRTVVAAGAPWFMTLFGRDSLLTSWMAMMVDSDLALGTLQTLARFQGDKVEPAHRGGARSDPARDALRRVGGARRSVAAASTTAASTPRRCSSCSSASCGAGATGATRSTHCSRGRSRARVDRRVRRPRRRRLRRVPAHQRPRPAATRGGRTRTTRSASPTAALAEPPDRAVRGAGLRVRRADRAAHFADRSTVTTSSRPSSARAP